MDEIRAKGQLTELHATAQAVDVIADRRRAVAEINELRKQIKGTFTIEEILSFRDEGRRGL